MLTNTFPRKIARCLLRILLLWASLALTSFNVIAQSDSSNATNSKGEIEEIKREISALKDRQSEQKNRPKDIWEKLGTISTLISGLLVTAIGLYATQKYAERQREKEARIKHQEIQIQQVEIVEKFFPYLVSGGELRKSAALQAIATIGNEKLALRLAKIFEPTLQTGENVAPNLSTPPAPIVSDIERINELLKLSIVLITSWDGAVGVGFFCTRWGLIIALDFVVQDMPKALINVTTADGRRAEAQVWLIDTQRGVALLSSRLKEETAPLHCESVAALPDTEVFTICHNSAEETFIPLSGRISKYQILEPNKICVDMEYLRVMAGAPVLTGKGQLIGIVSEYNPETRQAILVPASVIEGAFIEHRKDIGLWKDRQKEEYMLSGNR